MRSMVGHCRVARRRVPQLAHTHLYLCYGFGCVVTVSLSEADCPICVICGPKVTDKNTQRGGAATASSLLTRSANCRKDTANVSTTTATYAPTTTMGASTSNARLVSSPWRSFRVGRQLGTVSVDSEEERGGRGTRKMEMSEHNKWKRHRIITHRDNKQDQNHRSGLELSHVG